MLMQVAPVIVKEFLKTSYIFCKSTTSRLSHTSQDNQQIKSGLTLQFDTHGDMWEAAQDSHDLIVLLLLQRSQHAASV